MKKISIIIVNYNGKHLLESCLESVYNQSFENIEIIFVDNASRDDSTGYVNHAFPAVKIVPLTANIGFAGANNEGLKHASGDYIMLLNNDAEGEKDCLQNLYAAMEADPEIGIAAAKMVVSGKDIIDSAGDGFSTLLLKGFKRGEGENIGKYDRQEYVFGACAGAALYRRKMFEEIGFFDEDFFLIYEDTDLNFRAQLAGWKALYVPSAIVHHRVRSTIGNMSDAAIYYSLRNSELTRIKNVPIGFFLRYSPFYVICTLFEFIYFAMKHSKLKVYIKAKSDAAKLLPRMLGKRKRIMMSRKVDNRYFYELLSPCYEKEYFISKFKKFMSSR